MNDENRWEWWEVIVAYFNDWSDHERATQSFQLDNYQAGFDVKTSRQRVICVTA